MFSKNSFIENTIPTIGFNVESVKYKSTSMTAWDVGGRSPIRPLYRFYFEKSDGLVFVVDSNDRDRIDQCHDEFTRVIVLLQEVAPGIPILVLANKSDLPNAMSSHEVAEHLHLTPAYEKSMISKGWQQGDWRVFSCCAITKNGLHDGFSWLNSRLQYKSSSVKEKFNIPTTWVSKFNTLVSHAS
mmetsp:Transcript_24782/g.36555  ORF Transcript_24782/g.36555 Transcript_24782/m.36555 type:complete len:185 (+) Transcript_24782:184-738(+)